MLNLHPEGHTKIVTFLVSGRGNRIGLVRLSVCVCVCVSVSALTTEPFIMHGKKILGRGNFNNKGHGTSRYVNAQAFSFVNKT